MRPRKCPQYQGQGPGFGKCDRNWTGRGRRRSDQAARRRGDKGEQAEFHSSAPHRHQLLGLLRRNRRFDVGEAVMEAMGPVHRTHEGQHRRVEEVAVIAVLEKAHRQAASDRPQDDSKRVLKLSVKAYGHQPRVEADEKCQLAKECDGELEKRERIRGLIKSVLGFKKRISFGFFVGLNVRRLGQV